MICPVIRVYQGNAELYRLGLKASIALDGNIDADCVLMHDIGFDVTEISAVASEAFKCIHIVPIAAPQKGPWPIPQNRIWQQAALYMQESSPRASGWLWWEADAVPVTKAWLEQLSLAHESNGKKFSGVVRKDSHMNGVGIYPMRTVDALARSSAIFCKGTPFDIAAGPTVLGSVHDLTGMMIADPKLGGTIGHHFSAKDLESLKKQHPALVFYHGCGDGSLHGLIAGIEVQIAPQAQESREDLKANSKLIIQLGRYGDIINILPIAKLWSEWYGEPIGVVANSAFADILDGCSYVRKIVTEIPFNDPLAVMAGTKRLYPQADIHCTQVYGKNLKIDQQCDSFTKESWRMVNMLSYWGLTEPVFDRRDSEREKKLVEQTIGNESGPVILVNLHGNSSPYPKAKELMEDIRFRWSRFAKIIDLKDVKAERFYDLLGLFDKATVLITSDTGTLHLAAASAVTTIALRTDLPSLWHGAITHRESILTLRYRESWMRRQIIHEEMGMIDVFPDAYQFTHVFLDFKGEGETLRRNALAKLSWEKIYNSNWSQIPIADEQLPRLFNCNGRLLPYIKDVIDFGLAYRERIVLSNTDTCFSPDLEKKLKGLDNAHAHRRDFERLDSLLSAKEIKTGKHYPGSDLFVISRKWWEENRSKMPDMIFGAEGWDCCLRVLMEETGQPEIKNVIYHERHVSRWEKSDNRMVIPSQLHCRPLGRAFLTARNIDPKKHGL